MLSRDEYITSLNIKGWMEIGSGVFSTVFGKDDEPYVIKVGRFPLMQDGWGHFANYAMTHRSPYLPKITDLEEHDGFYAAKIERLSPLYNASNERTRKAFTVAADVINGWRPSVDDPPKALVKLVKDIREQFDGIAKFDLHDANIMVRHAGKPNERLVITDPLSYVE